MNELIAGSKTVFYTDPQSGQMFSLYFDESPKDSEAFQRGARSFVRLWRRHFESKSLVAPILVKPSVFVPVPAAGIVVPVDELTRLRQENARLLARIAQLERGQEASSISVPSSSLPPAPPATLPAKRPPPPPPPGKGIPPPVLPTAGQVKFGEGMLDELARKKREREERVAANALPLVTSTATQSIKPKNFLDELKEKQAEQQQKVVESIDDRLAREKQEKRERQEKERSPKQGSMSRLNPIVAAGLAKRRRALAGEDF